jgi:hypothetical protein
VKKAKTRKITDQQEYLLFALTVVIQHLLSPYVQHHYLVVMLLPIIVLSHALFNTINLTTKDYIQFILLFTFLSLQASPVSFRSFYHGPKSVAFALPLIGIIFTALLLKKVLLADQEISKTITT